MNIENKIQELKKLIGTPYSMFFEDGNYCGCFMPIYFVYDFLPRYPLPTDDPADNWDFGVECIAKNAYEINKDEVRLGDVLVTRFKNELHVGLCLDSYSIIHVFRDNSLEIAKSSNYFKDRLVKYYRVKDV